MKHKKLSLFLAAVLVTAALAGCTKQQAVVDNNIVSQNVSETTKTEVTVNNAVPLQHSENYKLEQMVVMSRHNIRSPLSGSGSTLGKMTTHTWTEWSAPTGELSLRGGMQETAMGQYFRKYLVAEGLMPENWLPEDGEVRFYSNSMQRTIATAQYFASGMLPVANQNVEYKYAVGTMDPVFTPKLTFVSEAFRSQAMKEIEAMGGAQGMNGITSALSDNYRLLEEVLDFKDSEYAKENGITSLPANDLEISLELDKEPAMKGSLKTATSASDALVLQYYEEPDDKKAAFGKELTREQWTKLAHITDTYQNVLFTAPSVAVNVAHPLLMEMENELSVEGRKFTFLCGHDSNISSVLASLEVKQYTLPETVSQETPIGCKLVVEKWSGADGQTYATVSLVYQTVDQLRNCNMLDLKNPPMKVMLEFEGLQKNSDGFYRFDDLKARFDKAIAAYDSLPADVSAAA